MYNGADPLAPSALTRPTAMTRPTALTPSLNVMNAADPAAATVAPPEQQQRSLYQRAVAATPRVSVTPSQALLRGLRRAVCASTVPLVVASVARLSWTMAAPDASREGCALRSLLLCHQERDHAVWLLAGVLYVMTAYSLVAVAKQYVLAKLYPPPPCDFMVEPFGDAKGGLCDRPGVVIVHLQMRDDDHRHVVVTTRRPCRFCVEHAKRLHLRQWRPEPLPAPPTCIDYGAEEGAGEEVTSRPRA